MALNAVGVLIAESHENISHMTRRELGMLTMEEELRLLAEEHESKPHMQACTAFSRLSPEAQDLIVRAALGEFDLSGPPPMSDELKAELHTWCNTVEG